MRKDPISCKLQDVKITNCPACMCRVHRTCTRSKHPMGVAGSVHLRLFVASQPFLFFRPPCAHRSRAYWLLVAMPPAEKHQQQDAKKSSSSSSSSVISCDQSASLPLPRPSPARMPSASPRQGCRRVTFSHHSKLATPSRSVKRTYGSSSSSSCSSSSRTDNSSRR